MRRAMPSEQKIAVKVLQLALEFCGEGWGRLAQHYYAARLRRSLIVDHFAHDFHFT